MKFVVVSIYIVAWCRFVQFAACWCSLMQAQGLMKFGAIRCSLVQAGVV